MNNKDDKKMLDKRNVLDYTTLNVTIKELTARGQSELAEKINGILQNSSIIKPELHGQRNNMSSTYYQVDLTEEEINLITGMFVELETIYVGGDGQTTPTASFYASLLDRWSPLLELQ
jgi:hypothetical protein